MLYFKKVNISQYTPSEVEFCVRKESIKRTMPLDLDFSSINIGTDKSFLARGGKNGLTFTRIQTSFEKPLPKLVSKLSIEPQEAYYKIRLSTLATAVFIGFTLLWFSDLASTLLGGNPLEDFVKVSTIYMVYLALILLEYKLTISKVDKAIRKNILLYQ